MLGLVVTAATACGSPPSMSPDASIDGDPDAAAEPDAPPDASTLVWETVEPVSNDGSVIVEDVTYRSDGLLVRAKLCRPAGNGPYPIAIYNHGGFDGLALDPMAATCQQSAQFGYVWLGSSYRGEEGSEGTIEVCLGEVTDVIRMLEIARAQPYAAPGRVVMWGQSHGGCVTLRALERGAPVKAAAAIFGPSDIARVYQGWVDRIAANDPQTSFYELLRDKVKTGAGGTPTEVPAAYTARSPLAFAADLPANVPLLITHGLDDTIVPLHESCSFAAAATGFATYHLDGAQETVATVPSACSAAGLTWQSGAVPRGSWPGNRYFLAYDGLGHDIAGDALTAMQEDVGSFLLTKAP
jgi:cephalosporin-C deacetylase-like acetyl esterase